MSIFDTAKETLKEIQLSDVMRARLEFAFDQSATLEKQVSTISAEKAQLQAELKIAKEQVEENEAKLHSLEEKYSEVIRIHNGIEFRKGIRTNNNWVACCPKCSLPVDTKRQYMQCADQKCGWVTLVGTCEIRSLIKQIES